MYVGPNLWESEYKARNELSTVEYILASHFDDVFIADIKETFENVLRTDSKNSLVAPFNFFNYRGINLSDPTADTDAVNKKYLNNQIYRFEGIKTEQESVYGDYPLAHSQNKDIYQYSMVQGGPLNFVLPAPANKNVLNQIMVDFKTMSPAAAINLGTTFFVNKTPLIFAENNTYTIIWEFSNQLNAWVVGALLKGESV